MGNRGLWIAAWATAIGVFAGVGPAAADGTDAERFVPATGAQSDFTAEHPSVPFHLGFGVGLFFDVADDPLVEEDADTGDVVSRPLDLSLSANLLASIGLFDRFELGVHLPLHLIYEGDDYVDGPVALAASGGLGDLRLVPKLELWGGGDADRHALFGVALPVGFPTGDDEALRGSGGFSLGPRLLFAADIDRIGLVANLGYLWRSAHPAGLPVGDEITFDLAGSYALSESLALDAELFGGKQVATDAGSGDFMLEALGGVRWWASDSLRVYGGASFGVIDGLGEPDFRLIAGVRYAHRTPERHGFADSDGDGLIDREDDCPDAAEDEDGFADQDGCPDPDNDHDGIADADDECPDLPEERGGDGDGCPSHTYVEISEGKIVIFGKVQFATGSDRIQAKSEPLLDQIAAALEGNPQVHRVRVEGYTDNVGGRLANQSLSDRRAKRVKEALIERGIDEDRLESKGYGESNPIAPNRTRAGRAKNRRVEFIVVQ